MTFTMAERLLKLRWAASCGACATQLPARSDAWWDNTARTTTCVTCHGGAPGTPAAADLDPVSVADRQPETPPLVDAGIAGASAQRTYDKKAARLQRENERTLAADQKWREDLIEQRPVVGRLASVLTPRAVAKPVPQSTRAWREGADGERRVAIALDAAHGVVALHDRKVPGSKANIDHIAVGPAGVYVIDAKNYRGKLEARDVGGLFRTDERLFINGRDRTKLVTAMQWQIDCVRKVFADDDLTIHGVLCSVSTEWSLLAIRPPRVRGVTIAWPKALTKLVSREGPLDTDTIRHVAARLSAALPPA